jgi:hypothetical protein
MFLSRTWWAIGPLFIVLAGRLAVDRACADPYNLVPVLASRPVVAWTMAVVYVLAHVWLLGLYLEASSSTSLLVPTPRSIRTLWGSDRWKVWALLLAVAVEYAPLAVVSIAGRACG